MSCRRNHPRHAKEWREMLIFAFNFFLLSFSPPPLPLSASSTNSNATTHSATRGSGMQIRDGGHGFSTLLGQFCGSEFPPMITSRERRLWLRFHSDENIEYEGFTIVYEFIARPTTCTYARNILTRQLCVHILIAPSSSSMSSRSFDPLPLPCPVTISIK